MRWRPGTRYSYANSGPSLAAYVVEKITGQRFEDYVQNRIFDPLKMEGAAVFERSDILIRNRAYGYRRTRRGWVTSHSDLATTGDGAVFCSIENFARWDAELRAPTLVKPETLKHAFTPGKLDDGTAHAYGYGWMISKRGDKTVVQHSGGWMGASTHITRFLDGSLTVVVLSSNDGFDPGRVAGRIVKLYDQKR